VRLHDWIDHRIAAEVEVSQDGSILLHGEAKMTVQQKYIEIEEWAHMAGYQPGGSQRPLAGSIGTMVQQERLAGNAPNVDAANVIPPRMLPIRKALEKARLKQPDAFDRKMTLSDLKRLMDSLGVEFKVGECAAIAKQFLGSSNPTDVLREWCADILKFGGKTQKKAHRDKETAEVTGSESQASAMASCGADDDDGAANGCASETASLGVADKEPEELFSKLPPDKLWSQEKRLRGCLLKWMRERQDADVLDPLLLDEALNDPQVERASQALLQRYNVPLQEWITRRLQEDVSVGMDEEDRVVLFPLVPLEGIEPAEPKPSVDDSATGPAERRQHNNGFIGLLSSDGISSCEEALAEGIVRYVETWSGKGNPTLGGKLPEFVSAERAALLQEVYGDEGRAKDKLPFKRWIEARIPDRIALDPVGNNGQFEIRVLGSGKRKASNASQSVSGKRIRQGL